MEDIKKLRVIFKKQTILFRAFTSMTNFPRQYQQTYKEDKEQN